jgi:hypothetical protein
VSVRGIPEQDKLENQDPDVLFMTDELTGERTPIEVPGAAKPAPKPTPKPAAPKKEATRDDAAKGEGE